MSESNQKLRIWDSLGKTDPKHTNKFTRSGGFSGTAVKPMWCNLRMTEYFGPCGIGWGMDKPEFQVHAAGEEMLVFCTVGLWYREPDKSDPVPGRVYGVGGDRFLLKQKDGFRVSDEAFKAAFTDALSNAMKFIGVAADVHMGLFDDNKYVTAMKREFDEEPEPEPEQPKPQVKFITSKQAEEFRSTCIQNGKQPEAIKAALHAYKIDSSAKIPATMYDIWMGWARNEEELPS